MKCTLVLEAESPSEMQTLLQKLSGSLQVEKTVAGALPEIHSPEPETRRRKAERVEVRHEESIHGYSN